MKLYSKKWLSIGSVGLIAISLMSSTANSNTGQLNITPQPSASKSIIDELTFQLPNGRIVVTKPNQAPYCAIPRACDFPIDCYGNSPAPKSGYTWECKNALGACVGKCYQQPITSQQEARQKVLATIVSGG